ncbi:MAG: AI-2E family transporter [Candidatus Abyssobacteria bacterium SURF_5]|uniref:AI-2E family transporter n=1 Tax=Abyssobacteria bacterium (strain SURF_5) TaxID=2093360 RepID=A0A3A4P0K1_ABYX5|nr:MAG: AI-2E family transporter [Candidatus Abyssubacteria bacterium SURF_5]
MAKSAGENRSHRQYHFSEQVPLLLLFLAVLYTLYFARTLLLPIAFALFLSILFRPLVNLLNRLKIPDFVGAALVALVLVSAVLIAFYQLSEPATKWLERGPTLRTAIDRKLGSVRETIRGARETTEQIEEIAELEGDRQEVVVKGPSLAKQVLTVTQSTLATSVIIVVLLYFLLACGRQTLERVIKGLGAEKRGRWEKISGQIQREIGIYLRTYALVNLGLGIMTGIAMALLGMPNPVLWGILAAIVNFVPYVGPAVTLVVLGAVALLTFDHWLRILLPPLAFFVLTSLEGQVITPSIMGRQLTMNPIAVFVGILFWGWIWGIPGILLAVPILTVLRIIFKNVDQLKPLSRVFD